MMTMTVTNKELSSFVAIHTSQTMKSPSSNATTICFGQIPIVNCVYMQCFHIRNLLQNIYFPVVICYLFLCSYLLLEFYLV